MKRRSLLGSIIALPVLGAQHDTTAARDKGLPAGPPLVPPGIEETPNTPVIPADQTSGSVTTTLRREQLEALVKLGEIVVPAWDGKPGASEAGAAEFLDFLVGVSPESRINLYKNGLDTLNRKSQEKFGKPFGDVNSEQADTLLAPLRQPWTEQSQNGDSFRAFLFAAKSDLLRATVNSRPYIDAIAQTRRARNASRFYWRPIE